jgi:glucose/arabinose dehydrogenase
MRAFLRLGLVAFSATVLASACGDDDAEFPADATSSATTSSDASTGTGGSGQGGMGVGGTATGGSGGSGGMPLPGFDCSPAEGALPALTLTPIAAGLSHPVLVKSAPDDPETLYIAQQGGKILIFKDGALLPTPFLDIEDKVSYSGQNGDERGLLGLAFHPDYAQNGRFFVHYSDADNGGDTMIAELHRDAVNPELADPASLTPVLMQSQPESNHNGGSIEFSPLDGMLYIGLGDGGGAEDMHGSVGNGQDTDTLLGKILRIDVSSLPYTIPAGNLTTAGALPEIWDYGIRNPWRFSFDACTSDLYIGDVGQYAWEEVNVEPAGQGNKNYGWRLMEGTHCFNPTSNCDPNGDTVLPVAEYSHSVGCSITGGYVYRGSRIPGLRGQYLYGDYCKGRVWAFAWKNDGQPVTPVDISDDLGSKSYDIVSFGQDGTGELYVIHQAGDIFRIDAE